MPRDPGPEFDHERLARRQAFLLDRARNHQNTDDDNRIWHITCVASLKRDAATIAILRGEANAAQGLFQEAGSTFATLGVFVGLSLLELSHRGAARSWRANFKDFDARIDRALSGGERPSKDAAGETSYGDRGEQPFLTASATSPRQLLHLYHALISEGDSEDDTASGRSLRARVQEALSRIPELPLGPAGIPLGGYLSLLDEVAHLNPRAPRLTADARDAVLSAVLLRNEQLRAARADRHHWQMVPNPADLVDLDLVALATILVDRTGSTALFDDIIGERDALVTMPLRAATLLRPSER